MVYLRTRKTTTARQSSHSCRPRITHTYTVCLSGGRERHGLSRARAARVIHTVQDGRPTSSLLRQLLHIYTASARYSRSLSLSRTQYCIPIYTRLCIYTHSAAEQTPAPNTYIYCFRIRARRRERRDARLCSLEHSGEARAQYIAILYRELERDSESSLDVEPDGSLKSVLCCCTYTLPLSLSTPLFLSLSLAVTPPLRLVCIDTPTGEPSSSFLSFFRFTYPIYLRSILRRLQERSI